jgi:flagellar hook-associated protein 2
MVSTGFASREAPVGAGTVRVELGNGVIDRETTLDLLNGGRGVARGSIRITDRSGSSAVVDLSGAVSVADALSKINSAGIGVSAGLSNDGNRIVLTDGTGGALNLRVENVGSGATASDLGIVGSVAAATLTGNQVNRVTSDTQLLAINDSLGVSAVAGNDIAITNRLGAVTNIDLSGLTTVGDAVDRINAAAAGVTAAIAADGVSLQLTDTTLGGGAITVAALNGSRAGYDLGLIGSTAGPVHAGDRLIAGMNDMLLRNISGANGTGIALGSIDITNKNGVLATVDLSGAETVQDVIRLIETTGPAGISVDFNPEDNGFSIQDATGGNGKLKVAEVASTTASDLGILNAAGTDSDRIDGTDLDAHYISRATLVRDFNLGKGVTEGSILVTDRTGDLAAITLAIDDDATVGDLLDQIESQAAANGLNITASINDTGDGILLHDNSGGGGNFSVQELSNGTTASELNLVTSVAAADIDA